VFDEMLLCLCHPELFVPVFLNDLTHFTNCSLQVKILIPCNWHSMKVLFLLMDRSWFAERNEMTKLAGYSLAVSFAPISSNILRNNCRFPLVISRRNKFSNRLFSTHALKAELHDKSGEVSRHYLPPWFRCVPGNSICALFLFFWCHLSVCIVNYADYIIRLVWFSVG